MLALKSDLAAYLAAFALHKLQKGERNRALSRAAFPGKPQNLSGCNLQSNVAQNRAFVLVFNRETSRKKGRAWRHFCAPRFVAGPTRSTSAFQKACGFSTTGDAPVTEGETAVRTSLLTR